MIALRNLHHIELVRFPLDGDAFFTLYTEEQLLYVSEVASGLFLFGVVSLSVSSVEPLTFNLWVRDGKNAPWRLWYKLRLNVASLVPVSQRALSGDHKQFFAENTVLWCFGNDHYCVREQLSERARKKSHADKPSVTKASMTLDDIRLITRLDVGVSELRQAKEKLATQIDQVVAQSKSQTPISEQLRALKFKLHTLHKYIARQRTLNDTLQSEIYAKKLRISKGHLLIEEEYPQFQEIYMDRLAIAAAQVPPLLDLLHKSVYPNIFSSLRHVGSVLQQAFPIELVLATGRLALAGLEFPSSVAEILDLCYYGTAPLRLIGFLQQKDADTQHQQTNEIINAGLSNIVLLLEILASLMNITLKYPMRYFGSRSCLVDVLSPEKKVLPLYYNPEQTEKFASYENSARGFVLSNAPFEQGLTLLSKNLLVLITGVTDLYSQYYQDKTNHQLANNIPADCLDNFLWNLQYVLLFMTASDLQPRELEG